MTTSTFRKSFKYFNTDVLQWFPGHMASGMKAMQQKLKSVDCIVEVHDARVPISGRNSQFYNLLTAVRPLILALNKEDMIDSKQKDLIIKKLKTARGVDEVVFTNCKNERSPGIKRILPAALELISKRSRFNREYADDYVMMIIGIPNVGKSSIINQLRSRNLKKAKATQVGALPGVTRSVLERIKISQTPPIYLLDTPGVLAPNIKDIETGLKLALCGVLKDHLVGEDIMADYLLYFLNKTENFSYVDYLGLNDPCDDITKVLVQTAINLKKSIKLRTTDGSVKYRPNLTAAASHMITAFRNGEFGRINLDQEFFQEAVNLK